MAANPNLAARNNPPLEFQQAVLHRKFASYYSDEARDPYRLTYASVLARFDPEGAVLTPADVLLDAAISRPEAPNTYLCCTTLHGGSPKVYCVHMPSRFPVTLAGNPSTWENSYFATLGEVVGPTATTITFPATAFDPTPYAWVYESAHIVASLDNLAQDERFPRLAANTAGATRVRSRYFMYIPAKYSVLLLRPQGYTIKEAWMILYAALQQDNFVAEGTPLINWLRLTFSTTQNNNNGPPVTSITLTCPAMDDELFNHRSYFITQALPGLSQPTPGLEHALFQMANAIATNTEEQKTARLAADIARDRILAPSDKFGILLPSLKRYLLVEDEALLPEFWHHVSQATKKQEFAAIREFFDNHSRSPLACMPLALIPSPKLASDLMSITFIGESSDDWKTGISPFITMDGSEEHRLASLAIAEQYTQLQASDHTITLSELERLKVPKDLRALPTSFFELEKSFGLFGNLLQIIFGPNHTLTQNYLLFWQAFTSQHRLFLQHTIDLKRHIKPIHLLRSVQLLTFQWLSANRSHLPPDPPNFLHILNRLALAEYTIPFLPPQLHILTAPKPPSIPTTATVTTTITPRLSDASSVTPSITSNMTGSILTTPTNVSRAGAYVSNPSPDYALVRLVPNDLKIKTLIGPSQPPNNDAGQVMCLSYHVKMGCFSNCRRKLDHRSQLSPLESQRLANYIADRLEALKPPPSTANTVVSAMSAPSSG